MFYVKVNIIVFLQLLGGVSDIFETSGASGDIRRNLKGGICYYPLKKSIFFTNTFFNHFFLSYIHQIIAIHSCARTLKNNNLNRLNCQYAPIPNSCLVLILLIS